MNKPIEQQLKELILSRYKSVREFAISANIPTSTFATILRRGIRNANIWTVFRICSTLSIDIDNLMDNKIVDKATGLAIEVSDKNILVANINGGKQMIYQLDEDGLKIIIDMANALSKINKL